MELNIGIKFMKEEKKEYGNLERASNNIRKNSHISSKSKNSNKRKGKIGFLWKSLLFIISILVPPVLLVVYCFSIPAQYTNTFMGELSDKYKRLYAIESPKIVVIGGSSVAFGLNSQELEAYTGYPVVNFGLYATLGTKVMLDLSKSALNKGDIVILAPEINDQTLSLYFNGESMWQAAESNLSMLSDIGTDNWADMAETFWDFAQSKIKYQREGAPNPNGVYRHDSFNEYGDIIYERPYNQMQTGYDMGTPIKLSPDIVSQEFIDYVNDYISYAKKKGASVYFSYSPMNQAALEEGTTEDSIYQFFCYLNEQIQCQQISNINDYILDYRYFYDSNFHLNDSGVQIRTTQLAEDLCRTLGMTKKIAVAAPPFPEAPKSEQPTQIDGSETDWTKYFSYTPFHNADQQLIGYIVSGLSEEGNSAQKLEIPEQYQGLPVLNIAENAFQTSTALTDITIRSNIKSISSGAFANCPTLTGVHIYNEDESTMTVDQQHLMDGTINTITIYLYSKDSYMSYATGYFWGAYSQYMKLVE